MLLEKDYLILEQLMENSRISYRQISQIIGIPVMTVMNRVKKMENEGVIKSYTLKIDHEKLGLNIIAYMLINTNYLIMQKDKVSSPSTIAERLVKYPFISCISNLAGKNDVLLRIRARDVRELNRFVNKIGQMEGIQKTETFLVLNDISRSVQSHKKLFTFLRDKEYAQSLLK